MPHLAATKQCESVLCFSFPWCEQGNHSQELILHPHSEAMKQYKLMSYFLWEGVSRAKGGAELPRVPPAMRRCESAMHFCSWQNPLGGWIYTHPSGPQDGTPEGNYLLEKGNYLTQSLTKCHLKYSRYNRKSLIISKIRKSQLDCTKTIGSHPD